MLTYLRLLIKPCYLFKLSEDYSVLLKDYKGGDRTEIWCYVRNDVLTVKKGYAWNGCSPRYSLLDLVTLGTANGITDINTGLPLLYYASLIHDCSYQYKLGAKEDVDSQFLEEMNKVGFSLSTPYYLAVKWFGKSAFYKRNVN